MSRLTVDDLKLERDGSLFFDPKVEARRHREWLATQPGRFRVTVTGTREVIVEQTAVVEVEARCEAHARELAEMQARSVIDFYDDDNQSEHDWFSSTDVERVE